MARHTKSNQMDLVLVAIEGDVEPGTRYEIPNDGVLAIGRSSKGLQLLDPLVSIQHAEISYSSRRGYVVEDLDSATGTWVDEEFIRQGSRPIGVGTVLRFGDTVFEVRSKRSGPGCLPLLLLGMLSLMMVTVVLGIVLWLLPERDERTWLALAKPAQIGQQRMERIPVDLQFIRERAVLAREISVRNVTDADHDGNSEIWLRLGSRGGAVITLDPEAPEEGRWEVLGEYPDGCIPEKDPPPGQFPSLECGGYLMLMGEDGYAIDSQEGVVVYFRPPGKEPPKVPPEGKAGKEGEGPESLFGGLLDRSDDLEVGRFSLKNPNHLAGFLADRGLSDPVHYVICEDAFKGLVAQALRADGGIQQFEPGCIHELRLEGAEGKPVAFALTSTGHEALIDDVTSFYGGNPDGLWLSSADRKIVDPLRKDPGFLVGGARLVADANDPDIPYFTPKPDQPLRGGDAHPLIYRDERVAPAPRAWTASVYQQGRFELSTTENLGGCARLQVTTSTFESSGWSRLFPSAFMSIEEIGCGKRRFLKDVGYSVLGGAHTFETSDGAQVRVVVESAVSGQSTAVRRARISYRKAPE